MEKISFGSLETRVNQSIPGHGTVYYRYDRIRRKNMKVYIKR